MYFIYYPNTSVYTVRYNTKGQFAESGQQKVGEGVRLEVVFFNFWLWKWSILVYFLYCFVQSISLKWTS